MLTRGRGLALVGVLNAIRISSGFFIAAGLATTVARCENMMNLGFAHVRVRYLHRGCASLSSHAAVTAVAARPRHYWCGHSIFTAVMEIYSGRR